MSHDCSSTFKPSEDKGGICGTKHPKKNMKLQGFPCRKETQTNKELAPKAFHNMTQLKTKADQVERSSRSMYSEFMQISLGICLQLLIHCPFINSPSNSMYFVDFQKYFPWGKSQLMGHLYIYNGLGNPLK